MINHQFVLNRLASKLGFSFPSKDREALPSLLSLFFYYLRLEWYILFLPLLFQSTKVLAMCLSSVFLILLGKTEKNITLDEIVVKKKKNKKEYNLPQHPTKENSSGFIVLLRIYCQIPFQQFQTSWLRSGCGLRKMSHCYFESISNTKCSLIRIPRGLHEGVVLGSLLRHRGSERDITAHQINLILPAQRVSRAHFQAGCIMTEQNSQWINE